jgi:rare lipoprotein A (peptidoglycan hydrolase)
MRYARKTLLAVLPLLACASPAATLAATPSPTGGASSSPSAAAAPTVASTPAGSTAAGGVSVPPTAHRATLASWFGPGFYGNKTACGQTMSPTIVGVANRTLPCGTLVKFAYKGHTLTVPVLDRGPYAKGVEWDLTAAAAHTLGLQETVKVGTRVVGQTANTPTLGLPEGALAPTSPTAPAPAAGGTAAAA